LHLLSESFAIFDNSRFVTITCYCTKLTLLHYLFAYGWPVLYLAFHDS